MSDHDILASHAMALKRELEQYGEQYDPPGMELVLQWITKIVMVIDRFPDADEQQVN